MTPSTPRSATPQELATGLPADAATARGSTTRFPGRAAQAPAGGTHAAAGVSPAGPRTYTVTFPAGLELLNANGRTHWRHRHRVTAMLRETAAWLARVQHIPPLARARIVAVYEPPDSRRRDAPNWYPSFKAAIDGLVDAGVLPDDSDRYVTALEMRCGEPCPRGRIVLHLTEVPGGEDAA